jgi:hypothetical protein
MRLERLGKFILARIEDHESARHRQAHAVQLGKTRRLATNFGRTDLLDSENPRCLLHLLHQSEHP